MLTLRNIKALLVLVAALSFMLPGLANAAQEYAGAYTSDLIWSGEVTMLSDVLILSGASLTIRAGTQVNVIPAEGTKIDPEYLSSQTELLVRGRLDVQGTAEAPVRFVVVSDENEAYPWAGITLDRSGKSRIAHAVIERADTAIRCVGASPAIVGNTISKNRYGIIAQQESHPDIIGNSLTDGEGGIFCWRGSSPRIFDNQVSGHDEEALFVDMQSRPNLGKNLISGNAVGLALYSRDLAYDQVVARDNREDLRWLGRQGQGSQQ